MASKFNRKTILLLSERVNQALQQQENLNKDLNGILGDLRNMLDEDIANPQSPAGKTTPPPDAAATAQKQQAQQQPQSEAPAERKTSSPASASTSPRHMDSDLTESAIKAAAEKSRKQKQAEAESLPNAASAPQSERPAQAEEKSQTETAPPADQQPTTEQAPKAPQQTAAKASTQTGANQPPPGPQQTTQKSQAEPPRRPLTPQQQARYERERRYRENAAREAQRRQKAPRPKSGPRKKSSVEKFIGENILSIVGVLLTIIGVGIGVKYAIDNEMISPLARILMAYSVGIGLAAFGMRLRKSYQSFAAVLVSGAMAVMYFVSYTAGVTFELMSLPVTFGLMWLITVLTVYAAFLFDRQVIAHIGLAGAYFVPFMLSTGSGNVLLLFSYMAIINSGILVVAVKKQWKPLQITTSLATWLIVFTWCLFEYEADIHFGIAMTFVPIFFAQFYAMILGYKVRSGGYFTTFEVLRLYSNAFVLFGLMMGVLDSRVAAESYQGLFTIANALLHFGVVRLLIKLGVADKLVKNALYGLALGFVTIAVPIELEGNHITIAWTAQALILFFLGRTRQSWLLEAFSYPLMAFSLMGMFVEWSATYTGVWDSAPATMQTPLLHSAFITGFFLTLVYVAISYINQRYPRAESEKILFDGTRFVNMAFPWLVALLTYFVFALEIHLYWGQLYAGSKALLDTAGGHIGLSDYRSFATIWLLNYTMFFILALMQFNTRKLQNSNIRVFGLVASVVTILTFLSLGLGELESLRRQFQLQPYPAVADYNFMYLAVRYVSFALLASLIYALRQALKESLARAKGESEDLTTLRVMFHLFVSIILLICTSSELITWMEMANSEHTFKLGLTILWALFALSMIIVGTARGLKHVRIAAIVLLGSTILKLFFYDITRMDTIPKVLVFLAIGISTLIGSFFYNKLRRKLADAEPAEETEGSAEKDNHTQTLESDDSDESDYSDDSDDIDDIDDTDDDSEDRSGKDQDLRQFPS